MNAVPFSKFAQVGHFFFLVFLAVFIRSSIQSRFSCAWLAFWFAFDTGAGGLEASLFAQELFKMYVFTSLNKCCLCSFLLPTISSALFCPMFFFLIVFFSSAQV